MQALTEAFVSPELFLIIKALQYYFLKRHDLHLAIFSISIFLQAIISKH